MILVREHCWTMANVQCSMFRDVEQCRYSGEDSGVFNPNLVHVAITLDIDYLRGSMAVVNSVI
ncbi:unnamed protein product [Arabidopsis halleri]